jgi:hypothetical protein
MVCRFALVVSKKASLAADFVAGHLCITTKGAW